MNPRGVLHRVGDERDFEQVEVLQFAALGIAAVKSTLVVLYFMHLRWEKRLLLKLLLPITLATLAVFIGLTYSDILVRYR